MILTQKAERKKVALFVPSLEGGGAERVMLNLARGFASRHLEVDLVLAKAEGSYFEQVPQYVRVVDLNARRVLFCLPALVRYLRCAQPHAMLATITHANIIAVLARYLSRTSVRVVVRQSEMPSNGMENYNCLKKRFFRSLMRYAYLWADGISVVSQGVGDALAEILGLSPDLMRVTYNPVVIPELFEDAREKIDHPWFGHDKPPVVLGVGSLKEEKDFSTLVRAFYLVQKRLLARLVILGEGGERESLEQLVEDLGLEESVDMPGFVGNPFPYFAKASVFALTSTSEGLPNVLIQAMALGTPVVSTDCISGPAEILDNGRYGRLVHVGDEEALATEILSILRSPETIDGEVRGLRRRAQLYSSDKVVGEYLSLLFGQGESWGEI